MAVEIYAWIAEDQAGHVGTITVLTPVGVVPAAFNSIELAEQFRDQAEMRAEMLGVEVRLVHFKEANTIATIKPWRNN